MPEVSSGTSYDRTYEYKKSYQVPGTLVPWYDLLYSGTTVLSYQRESTGTDGTDDCQ